MMRDRERERERERESVCVCVNGALLKGQRLVQKVGK
jgi:hypothetical protein